MYSMIDRYLPSNITLIDKDEQDQRLLLRSSWSKLLDEAQEAQASLQKMQSTYKRELILNINTLKADAKQFREDFVRYGPACPGIKPRFAITRSTVARGLPGVELFAQQALARMPSSGNFGRSICSCRAGVSGC